MGGTRAKLEALGIEALGITEDSAEPVRRYYRIRPSKLRLATDAQRVVHRDYGLPMPLYAGAYTELRETTLINPTGELPAPMPIPAGMKRLDEKDGLVALPEAKGDGRRGRADRSELRRTKMIDPRMTGSSTSARSGPRAIRVPISSVRRA